MTLLTLRYLRSCSTTAVNHCNDSLSTIAVNPIPTIEFMAYNGILFVVHLGHGIVRLVFNAAFVTLE